MKINNIFIKTLFLFLLSFSTFVLSQNKKIDSLKIELQNHKEKDTVRLKILNYLAFYNYRNDPPQALVYVAAAGELADEIQSVKGKARNVYIKGIIYMEQANFNVAINNFEEAIQLYNSLGDLNGIAKCKNGLGVLNYYKGNLNLALKYYEESLALKKQLGIKTIHGSLYNIGNIYLDMGDYQKALINFDKALSVHKKNNDAHGILNCLNSVAGVYYQQGNYPLSLEYYNESLQVAKNAKDSIGIFQSLNNLGNLYRLQNLNDKALNFYNKALAIKKAKYNPKNITALKNNIGGIYYDKEEFTNAILYFKESISLSRKVNDNVNLANGLNALGFTYFETKKYSKALSCFEEANKINSLNIQTYDLLDSYNGMANTYYGMKKYNLALVNAKILAELSEEYKLLKHKKNAYSILSEIYKNIGDYKKAFESHQQFKILNDSLFNKENIEKITQLEYEYKYKQALELADLRELKLTKTVNTVNKNLEKSQRNLLLGVIGFLITALILGTIIFFLKLRNEKAKTQNITIEQKLLRSQMTPHFIFNSLSVLQGMILNKEEKTSVSYLSKFSKLLRITLENSREKTVLLSQELIAIENYLALQNLENQLYQYTVLVADTIDVLLFKVPPMLIQPFVENAIEHGFQNQQENRKIDVHVSFLNKKLTCTITDNGVGIDSKEANKKQYKKSLSTTITSERIKILSKDFKMKGAVSIEDRKKYNEQGTLVTLVIPYKI